MNPRRCSRRQRLERGLTPEQFDVLKIGETRRLEKAAARWRAWLGVDDESFDQRRQG
jgi:hypothetical protein